MRRRDLRSSTCVCTEWRDLISDSQELKIKRDCLDPYTPINLIHSFGSRGYDEKGQFRGLYGICTWSNNLVVSDNLNTRIQLFDSNGQFISEFPCRVDGLFLLIKPLGICVSGENLLVADSENQRIHIFNKQYQSNGSFDCTGFKPRRICSNTEGQIIITTLEDGILILDKGGCIVKRIGFLGKENGQFTQPIGICTNSKGEILVVDTCNHRIQILSRDGRFLRKFGSRGNGKDQFDYPKGICVDWHDNIYVADCENNRISIFNREGIPLQQIPVVDPSELCLFGRKIIVTTYKDCIKIFSN